MAVNDIQGKINVADKIVGNITKQAIKIIGSVSKPIKPLSAREGVVIVTLIVLGTTYAPSGTVNNIEEETVNEY